MIRCRSYYNARYYDATLNRFIQPDSIIPNLYNPQYLNRYSYVRNNPVRYTDPTGHWTFGFGLGWTAGFGGGGTGSIMLVFDWHGNVGITTSLGGGGYAGIGGSFGGVCQATNADNISDLQGWSGQAGGSIAKGLSAGAETVYQDSKDGPVTGINLTIGPGDNEPIVPIELHGMAVHTDVYVAPIKLPTTDELNDYYYDDPVVLWP